MTPFGKTARTLRCRYGLTLTAMACAMGISGAYLSDIERGVRKLLEDHGLSAASYLSAFANSEEMNRLRSAIDQTTVTLRLSSLDHESRRLVSALAQRLQEGAVPPKELCRFAGVSHLPFV
jgi:transcriptional regulator with XRE-family HTH domain